MPRFWLEDHSQAFIHSWKLQYNCLIKKKILMKDQKILEFLRRGIEGPPLSMKLDPSLSLGVLKQTF